MSEQVWWKQSRFVFNVVITAAMFIVSATITIVTLRNDVLSNAEAIKNNAEAIRRNTEAIIALEKSIDEKFEAQRRYLDNFLSDMRSEARKDSIIMNTRIDSLDERLDSTNIRIDVLTDK